MIYFAYGSNMDRERLEARVGRCVDLGVRKLDGYARAVRRWLDIEESPGSTIEGVAYELTSEQANILDAHELSYVRADVILTDGTRAFTYVMLDDRRAVYEGAAPPLWYSGIVNRAIKRRGITVARRRA